MWKAESRKRCQKKSCRKRWRIFMQTNWKQTMRNLMQIRLMRFWCWEENWEAFCLRFTPRSAEAFLMFRNSVWSMLWSEQSFWLKSTTNLKKKSSRSRKAWRKSFTGMQVITVMYLRQTASKTRSIRKEDASLWIWSWMKIFPICVISTVWENMWG